MGNCNLKSEDEGSNVSSKYITHHFVTNFIQLFYIALSKALFEYKYAIGRGGFGKVWRVSSNRLKSEK